MHRFSALYEIIFRFYPLIFLTLKTMYLLNHWKSITSVCKKWSALNYLSFWVSSFIFCDVRFLPYQNIMKKMRGGRQVKRATVKEGHLWRKSTQVFFYPLRPIKLKKHERLVNSKISTGPHYRAWTIRFNWS